MKKLIFVIPTLDCGGAEYVMANLANYFISMGNQVKLLTFSSVGDDFFPVSKKVARVGIDGNDKTIWGQFQRFFNRLRMLRKEFSSFRPDAVVSFLPNANVLSILAARGLNVPVVVSERTAPDIHRIESYWEILRKVSYPYASGIVVQTKSLALWCEKFLPLERVFVIPNSLKITMSERAQKLSELFPEKCFVGDHFISHVGRFDEFKGQHRLVEGFAVIARRFPEWKLLLIGDGKTKPEVELLAKNLSISNQVVFAGRQRFPHDLLIQSHIFAFASTYEGFPNALLEAISMGVPSVSFDCPHGPSEIITNGENGFLVSVGDTTALFQKIEQLMGDKMLRDRISTNAILTKNRFSTERVMAYWEAVFEKVKI